MSSLEIRNILSRRLDDLVANSHAVDAALAVTADGHVVAEAQKKNYALKRLATMGSTLMALGDTITQELAMGSCRNIIAENEHGIVVFMHITRNLVMVSLTASSSSLGMLLSASRSCIASITQDVKNLKQTEPQA